MSDSRGRRRLPVLWLAVALGVIGCAALAMPLASLRGPMVVAGTARAGEAVGPSDEDQIVRVLQSISEAYNVKDVEGAERHLCARMQTQWNPALERVWMTYRLRHGTLRFTVDSIDVSGAGARVVGEQVYANDPAPRRFTATMGRGRDGWKMCSST